MSQSPADLGETCLTDLSFLGLNLIHLRLNLGSAVEVGEDWSCISAMDPAHPGSCGGFLERLNL